MERIVTQLFYSDNREQLQQSSMELMVKIHKTLLGREPNKSDEGRMVTRINLGDHSVNDIYFDNKKVGALKTNFIPGSDPTGITLEFIPSVEL